MDLQNSPEPDPAPMRQSGRKRTKRVRNDEITTLSCKRAKPGAGTEASLHPDTHPGHDSGSITPTSSTIGANRVTSLQNKTKENKGQADVIDVDTESDSGESSDDVEPVDKEESAEAELR